MAASSDVLIGLVLIFGYLQKDGAYAIASYRLWSDSCKPPAVGAVTHGTEIGILDVLSTQVLLMSYSPNTVYRNRRND